VPTMGTGGTDGSYLCPAGIPTYRIGGSPVRGGIVVETAGKDHSRAPSGAVLCPHGEHLHPDIHPNSSAASRINPALREAQVKAAAVRVPTLSCVFVALGMSDQKQRPHNQVHAG
jgi:hypothetical protein